MKSIKIILLIVIIGFTIAACSQDKTGDDLTIEDIESRFEGAAKQYQMLRASCHWVKIGAFVDRNWANGYSEEFNDRDTFQAEKFS